MACGMSGGVGEERLCSLHVSMQTSAPNQQTERKREREKRARGFDPAPHSKYLSWPWKVMLSFTNWKHICVCALCDRRSSGWRSWLRSPECKKIKHKKINSQKKTDRQSNLCAHCKCIIISFFLSQYINKAHFDIWNGLLCAAVCLKEVFCVCFLFDSESEWGPSEHEKTPPGLTH